MTRMTGPGAAPARFMALVAVAVLGLAGCAEEIGQDSGGPAASEPVGAFGLEVGDCLADFQDAETISGIEAAPCNEPHSDEIFAAVPGPEGAYPGAEAVAAFAREQCMAEFDAFVGLPYDDSVLDIAYVAPDRQSWGAGERVILCTVFDPAEEVSGSLRGVER